MAENTKSCTFCHLPLQIKTQNHNKLKTKERTRAYTKVARGESEENGEIECLHEETHTIDGEHEHTVWMHNGQSIDNPHHAIQQCRQIRNR